MRSDRPGSRGRLRCVVGVVLTLCLVSGCSLSRPGHEAVSTPAPVGQTFSVSGAGVPTVTASTPQPAPSSAGLQITTPSQASGGGTVQRVTVTTTSGPTGSSDVATIARNFQYYLYLMSGLDEYQSASWISALPTVATERLSVATVRATRTLIQAHEHGVGTVRSSHLRVVMTSATTAEVVDCEDYVHASVVTSTGASDPAVAAGYFVGTGRLVKQNGAWLVDVFAVTHATCQF